MKLAGLLSFSLNLGSRCLENTLFVWLFRDRVMLKSGLEVSEWLEKGHANISRSLKQAVRYLAPV